MLRKGWSRLLALVLFAGGCGRIIGANFDELRPAPECNGCAGDGGRAAAQGGAAGAELAGYGGSAGSDSIPSGGAGGSGQGGRGGAPRGGAGNDAGTSGEAGAAGGGGDGDSPCTTNAACLDRHPGEAYVCRLGACVPVATEDCPVVLPRADALRYLREESPVLVGALASADAALRYGTYQTVSWDLAFSEFASATSGGPGASRPLVLVVCDAFDDNLIPNLNHLTLDLGVTGFLVSLPPDKLLEAFDHTRDAEYRAAGGDDVFFLSVGSATRVVENLPDDGLVWHMLGSPRQLAETVAALVRHIEPFVQTQREAKFAVSGVDNPDTPIRLTLVTADAPSQMEISEILTSGDPESPETNLVINGELAITQAGFRQFETESKVTHVAPDTEAVAMEEVLVHPPHIVVAMATSEFAPSMTWIEGLWNQGASLGFMRPYYVFGTGLANNAGVLPVVEASPRNPPLHERIVGVNYAEAEATRARLLYLAYQSRLNAFTSDQPPGTYAGSENFYDAAYLLLYSYVAAGARERDVTAEELRDAFRARVISEAPDAASIDVGPAEVHTIVELLENPSNAISLYGTMGDPVFDRSTGVRQVPTSAWCIDFDGGTASFSNDALRYDQELEEFRGRTPPPNCVAHF